MAARVFALVCYFLGLLPGVCAQIRVLGPQKLVSKLGANGKIEGSTATFGAPFFGSRIFGRLVFGKSQHNQQHCSDTDYTLPPRDDTQTSETGDHKLIDIVMVRRGECSFVTKVRVAQEKGAHAVIIVDKPDSKLSESGIVKIIVADDGYGDGIHIPSILISKAQGAMLIDAVEESTVVLELKWDIPQNHVVDMDLWMSSGSQSSQHFLHEFAAKRRKLDQVVRFQPHYAVFSMPPSDPSVYNNLCTDTTGEYCAEDPDGSGLVTGKEVLEEDVRQLCIHEQSAVQRITTDLENNRHIVAYAGKYWDYVEKLGASCPLDAKHPQDRFGRECSERLMKNVGLDVRKVQECVSKTQTEKLKNERENVAWSPSALRINGWRYTGMLEADLVTRAICSGFIKQPQGCDDLLRKRDPFVKYTAEPPRSGFDVEDFLLLVCAGGLASLGVMFLYRRALKKHVERTIREEVTLEVHTQMATYTKMPAEF